MEKRNSSCPTVICEKMYRKVTVSHAFQTVRRISHRLQPPRYANPDSGSSSQQPPRAAKTSVTQSKPEDSSKKLKSGHPDGGFMVPVNFEHPSQPTVEKIRNHAQVAKAAHRHEPQATLTKDNAVKGPIEIEEHGKSGVHIEDRVTDYINRAKNRIRRTISTSHPGEKKKASSSGNAKLTEDGDPAKDKIADFIERTKKQLRKTSSIGIGKRNSSK